MVVMCYVIYIVYIYMYQFRSVRGGGAPAIWLVTLYNTRNIP